ALEKLQTLPLDRTAQRLAALVEIVNVNDFLTTVSQAARYLVEIQGEAQNLAAQLAATAASDRRPAAEELALMDFLARYLPDATFANPIQQRLASALRAIQSEVAQPWTMDQLPRGVPILNELVSLQLLLKQLQGAGINPNLDADLQPQALILVLNSRVQTAAQSNFQLKEMAAFARAVRGAAQRFGFTVPPGPGAFAASNALTSESTADPFAIFLFEQSTAATAAAAGVAGQLVIQFQSNQSSLLPFDLELPGNPKVTRVFGEVYYNRETKYLRGSFGGRLDFPEVNAYFEVEQATIASDGGFELDVSTAGPLPFGGVRVTASAHVIGQPDGFFSFDGSGELILPTMTTTQIYSVAVSYNTEDNRFLFNSTAQNLDLRF
ncbi:MAG TPA: hypothetical protein VLD18_05630, partial [Verrucomicrobiae bacterium]|nr:hypothetical protein [Verrucomicrobiae bacterium]